MKCCTGHHHPQENPWLYRSSVSFASTTLRSQPRIFTPFSHHPIPSLRAPTVEESTHFCFEAHTEGMASSQVMQSRDSATRTRQHSHLVAVTLVSHAVIRIPTPCTHRCTSRETQCVATTTQYNPCAPLFLFGGISPQCPDCLKNEGECSKYST